MITRENLGDKKENKISPKENKILKLTENIVILIICCINS